VAPRRRAADGGLRRVGAAGGLVAARGPGWLARRPLVRRGRLRSVRAFMAGVPGAALLPPGENWGHHTDFRLSDQNPYGVPGFSAGARAVEGAGAAGA